MFGFLVPRKRTAAAGARRARLVLEALEARDCPAAPQLTLAGVTLTGHNARLSGQVTADNPETVEITFGGVMMGTISPGSSGAYSYTASAGSLGTVTAVARDAAGLTSDTAQVQLTSDPPSVQLSVTYGQNRAVTLSGTVSDESPDGRLVTFTGSATGTTTTAADGTFSVQLPATSLGAVQAVTTDPWGLTSAAAQVTLTNVRPQITNFSASQESGNTWTFSGTVVDECPQGLRVQLGGLGSLTGQSATVAENGNFFLTQNLLPGERGTATASVTDWWGSASDLATRAVSNGP
jgi:hypothetical protein